MYLIAYDVTDNKRRYKIRKIAYSYAFGGQKSALEADLNKKEIFELAKKNYELAKQSNLKEKIESSEKSFRDQ